MIRALHQSQPPGAPALHCRLLLFPNCLFCLLTAPLLFRSPTSYEDVFRMASYHSGFTPAHELVGFEPQPFPVMPLG
jgi:hypothetical protein